MRPLHVLKKQQRELKRLFKRMEGPGIVPSRRVLMAHLRRRTLADAEQSQG
jgi:hypothetical protein